MNGLGGKIASEVGSMSQLKKLSLCKSTTLSYVYTTRIIACPFLIQSPPPPPLSLSLISSISAGNNLTGAIPTELRNLSHLHTLWLSDNDLSSSIPSHIGSMWSLVDVSLGRNALTGSVPQEIGRLQALQLLWLDHNNLSGRLPAEFALLTKLK
jgi:Leucine-rich repeat (LRR) protein